MNGFKLFVFFIFFLFSSCVVRNVREYEGDALFFVYRFIPPNVSRNIFIWDSPEAYIKSNNQSLTKSMKLLLKEMDPQSLVLLIGSRNINNYFIENIIYKNKGTLLEIQLRSVSSQIKKKSDLGYPVFIKNKNISSIIFLRDDEVFFVTNI